MASTSVTQTLPNDLLSLLKAELTGEEQELFLQGFHLYLRYDPKTDFVIDLEDVYEWLGFSRKDPANTILVKRLQEGRHYKTVFSASAEKPNGGRPTEQILMTVHGFKQLCMQAGTAKAQRVREYYLTMEEVLFEYTRQQLAERTVSEARLLDEKAHLEAQLEKQQERKYVDVPKMDNVYVAVEDAEVGTGRHKVRSLIARAKRVGRTFDPKSRASQFNTGSARGVKMIYVRPTHNGTLVESIVADAMKRYHFSKENYMCDIRHTINIIDFATTIVDTFASCYDSISRTEMLDKLIQNLENVRQTDEQPEEWETDDANPFIFATPDVYDAFVNDCVLVDNVSQVRADQTMQCFEWWVKSTGKTIANIHQGVNFDSNFKKEFVMFILSKTGVKYGKLRTKDFRNNHGCKAGFTGIRLVVQ